MMPGKPINRERLLGPYNSQVVSRNAKISTRLGVVSRHLDFAIDEVAKEHTIHNAPEQHVQYLLQLTLDSARRTLDEVNPFEEPNSWNSWYRLYARVAFAPKLVLARHAFARYDMDRRQEISYGSGDIATSIVESALENRNNAVMNTRMQSEISGVISEYTGIAVANYIEDGGRIALPSSYHEDVMQQIDGMYYWTNLEGLNIRTNTQTKSMKRARGDAQLYAGTQKERQPEKIVYFYADDFDNVSKNGEYKMSSMLVEQLTNPSDAHPINPEIEQASLRLWSIIQTNSTDQNSTDITIS
jgi:hypothetical protein